MKMETTHLPTVHETVLPDPDCTLFVDGSRFADEQGRYHTGFAVTTVDQVLQASPLPPSMSAQEAELKALTVACQMFEGKRVNIYTDSRYALGVAHDFGLIWKTRGFLTATGTPVKHGTAIKELMDALLLPEEVAILKVKAHGRRNSEETCGNHKADQAAKDAACESREVDRRVSGEEIPIFPMQMLPTDLKFLKEQQAAVSPEEKESWKQKGATLQDGVYTSNLKFCLPKSMYPPVVQWAHGAAHLSKTLMNSLITKYFEAPASCGPDTSESAQIVQIAGFQLFLSPTRMNPSIPEENDESQYQHDRLSSESHGTGYNLKNRFSGAAIGSVPSREHLAKVQQMFQDSKDTGYNSRSHDAMGLHSLEPMDTLISGCANMDNFNCMPRREHIPRIPEQLATNSTKLSELETRQSDFEDEMVTLKNTSNKHDTVIQSLLEKINDLENLNRRINLRPNNLPEYVKSYQLLPTLQQWLHEALGLPVSEGSPLLIE
ncbi:uncharacterized protein RCH25_043778 [Pelodytes ibericus]